MDAIERKINVGKASSDGRTTSEISIMLLEKEQAYHKKCDDVMMKTRYRDP